MKAALLALLAAAVLKILRIQDSNVRHRVWAGVLGGMLLLPALTLVVPALRLPLPLATERLLALSSANPASERAVKTAIVKAVPRRASETADLAPRQGELDGNSLYERPDRARETFPPERPWEQRRRPSSRAESAESDAQRIAAERGATAESPAAQPVVPPSSLVWRWAEPTLLFVSVLWLAGALVMASRLLLGLWTAGRLLAKSLALDRDDLPDSADASIPIRECPLIRVPLTVGCFRPQILLPPEWLDWPGEKLRAVLAHERMHAARADCAVALLAEVNCCLYWFHPLAWWLRQQLSSLAEQACDDAAIDSTGDRTQYARHLLEVAAAVSRQRGRLVPTGVSMARRCDVETRIHAILDFTRPLSRRLSWTSAAVLLAVMAPLIALAAALQPSAQQVSPQNAVTEKPAAQSAPEKQLEAKTVADITFTYAGTVVDDRGQPVAGAKIELDGWQATISDAQGKFSFSRRKSDFGQGDEEGHWKYAELIATKDGYGFASGASVQFETSGRLIAELTEKEREYLGREASKSGNALKLVRDDVPIRGRIVNSDGQPVAGAKIETIIVWEGKNGTLDDWLAATKDPGAHYYSANTHLRDLAYGYHKEGPVGAAAVPTVKTDEGGRFALHGLGRDRIAQIFVSGNGIETAWLYVRSQQGEVIKLPDDAASPARRTLLYYPAEFTLAAGPSVPVMGRVTEGATGKPLAGFVVQASKVATSEYENALEAAYIRTTTDADGRYRLEGLPLGENTFRVVPPTGSRTLIAGATVVSKAGDKPAEKDVSVFTGVRVHGRVTDSRTGKPVQGSVQYFAFDNNPHLNDATGFGSIHLDHHYRANSDGRYEIPVLPGPGVLTFNPDNHLDFPRGAGADQIDGPKTVTNAVFYQTQPFRIVASNFCLLTPLNPAPETEAQELNLSLASGASITARLRAADGQPLGEYYVYGDDGFGGWNRYPQSGESFEIKGYLPAEGRRITVYHPGRNLVGFTDVHGDAPKELELVLRPGGTLVGRVLDADGAPVEDASILADLGVRSTAMSSPIAVQSHGALITHVDGRETRTGRDGRFELKGIIPGLKYSAVVRSSAKANGRMRGSDLGMIFTDVTVEPGQTKDLGDLRPTPKKAGTGEEAAAGEKTPPAAGASPAKAAAAPAMKDEKKMSPPAAASNQAKTKADEPAAAATETAAKTRTYRGRIVDPQGKPIAGVVLRNADKPTGSPLGWMVDLFNQKPKIVSDAEGRFALTFSEQEATGGSGLVVSHPGYGAEWFDYPDEPQASSKDFVLFPERPIAGRLIDAEGRPLVGASVEVKYVWGPLEGTTLDLFLQAFKRSQNDAMTQSARQDPVLPSVLAGTKSDTEGRFVIKGLAAERICAAEVQAADFATTTLYIVNRPGFDGRPYNDAVPQFQRRFAHQLTGPDRAYVCLPDYKLEGRVTTADGQPVSGASIYGLVGHMGQTTVQTDAGGQYQLGGLPRGQETLISISAGNRLLGRTIGVIARADEARKTLDVVLRPGIVVKGRVTDPLTGQGVRGGIRFVPLPENEYVKQPGYDAFSRDGTMRHIDDQGNFELMVLPGPGVIMMQSFGNGQGPTIGGEQFSVYRQGKFSPEDRPKVKIQDNGGSRYFFREENRLESIDIQNFVQCVNYSADRSPEPFNFQLDRGKTVDLDIVDPDGQPVKDVFASGITDQWPIAAQLSDPRCTVYALGADRPRKVILLHAERRLAGTIMLTGDEPSPVRVTLGKAASFHGRAVDESGNPLAKSDLNVTFNDKSASELYRFHPSEKGRLTADADGRFTMDNVVPGVPFFINVQVGGKYLRPRPKNPARTVPPGENRDFKDIVFGPSD